MEPKSLFWKIVNNPVVRLGSAALVFAVSIYSGFLYERKPHLTVEVLSDAAVFDVRRPLQDLLVLYQGQDLRANKLDLRILTIKFMNSGSADIELNRYDDREPIGIQIDKGEILGSSLLVSDEYVKRHQKLTSRDKRSLVLAPVIINAGESFIIEVIVLLPEGARASVSSFGKLAGVKSFTTTQASGESRLMSPLAEAVRGRFATQSWRVLIYGLGTLLGAIALIAFGVLILTTLEDVYGRFKRRREMRAFSRRLERPMSSLEAQLSDLYVRDPHTAKFYAYLVHQREIVLGKRGPVVFEGQQHSPSAIFAFHPARSMIRRLQSMGLVEREKSTVRANAAMAKAASSFLAFAFPSAPSFDEEYPVVFVDEAEVPGGAAEVKRTP